MSTKRAAGSWERLCSAASCVLFFCKQTSSSLLLIHPPSIHAPPARTHPHARTHTDVCDRGGADLGGFYTPLFPVQSNFMVSSAHCAFASVAFRQGFICMCVFPCPVVFPFTGRGREAGHNGFDGRHLGAALEGPLCPCRSGTAGQGSDLLPLLLHQHNRVVDGGFHTRGSEGRSACRQQFVE